MHKKLNSYWSAVVIIAKWFMAKTKAAQNNTKNVFKNVLTTIILKDIIIVI